MVRQTDRQTGEPERDRKMEQDTRRKRKPTEQDSERERKTYKDGGRGRSRETHRMNSSLLIKKENQLSAHVQKHTSTVLSCPF